MIRDENEFELDVVEWTNDDAKMFYELIGNKIEPAEM